MHLSITPIIRKDALQKDGKTCIYIRLVCGRKAKTVSLGIKINPKNWNEKTQTVKPNEPMADAINRLITSKIQSIQLENYNLQSNNEDFGFTRVLLGLQKTTMVDFYSFATAHIAERPVKHTARKALTITVNWLKAFKPSLKLSDIDSVFIDSFKVHLQKKKLAKNTIISYLVRFRTLIAVAKRKKIIRENPFENYTIGTYTPKQDFITQSELFYIFNNLNKADSFGQSILIQFCFCCFTGLRFSDLHQLNYNTLRSNENGYYFDIFNIKGERRNIIVLSKFALQLIAIENVNGNVFNVKTNQYFNRGLKKALLDIGFERPATCHTARHTFITIGLQSGMQKEMVGKMAGHRKSSTTDGYTHLQTNDLFKELQKWNISPTGGG